MRVLLGLLACAFLIAMVFTTWEGGIAVIFGWVPFLGRAIPRMSADWGSIAVGSGATLLFAAGIHRIGTSWQRQRKVDEGQPRPVWKFRSTFAVVAFVLVLFAAGISIVGIVHQTAWLCRTDTSLYVGAIVEHGGNSVSTLKNIGLSLHTEHDMTKSFPPGGTFAPDGTMLHSWETHCLVGFNMIAHPIDLTKPWNDPVNQRYFKCIVPQFINPGFRTVELEDKDGYGLSHYAANSHVLGGNKSMKLADIKDGAANTLLIGEVNSQFKPWGYPVNWRDPTIGINQSPRGFGGTPNSGGANFAMADGSVRFVNEKISPDVLRALSTPNGGEVVREVGWRIP